MSWNALELCLLVGFPQSECIVCFIWNFFSCRKKLLFLWILPRDYVVISHWLKVFFQIIPNCIQFLRISIIFTLLMAKNALSAWDFCFKRQTKINVFNIVYWKIHLNIWNLFNKGNWWWEKMISVNIQPKKIFK